MQRDAEGQVILIVDDSPTNLRVAVGHLRDSRAQILTARSGEACLERAEMARPDLILLDVQLPGIDGFETCRRLKASPATAGIPVIFMTVLNNIEAKLRGFDAGGVDYISKPFQAEEMLARVRTHLTLYRLQRDLQAEIAQRHETELALRKANLELRRLAVLDELTQVANRRRFDEYLRSQWAAAPGPLSVLMCDVDYFKRYNDAYGHQAGDRCLQLVAESIGRALRHVNDLAARYGGEEFAVVLPGTDAAGAARVAEAIHEAVRRLAIPHGASDSGPHVTLSVGGAAALAGAGATPEALVAAADEALYAAKRAGRNRSVIAAGLPAANEVAR